MVHAPVVKLDRLDVVGGVNLSLEGGVVFVPLDRGLGASRYDAAQIHRAVDTDESGLRSFLNYWPSFLHDSCQEKKGRIIY